MIAGERVPDAVLVEPMIFTAEMLRDSGVTNMDELMEAFPEFARSDTARSAWMPAGSGR